MVTRSALGVPSMCLQSRIKAVVENNINYRMCARSFGSANLRFGRDSQVLAARRSLTCPVSACLLEHPGLLRSLSRVRFKTRDFNVKLNCPIS